MKYRLAYRFYQALYFVLGHLPWLVIEGLAYVLAVLLYGVVRYRREVVYNNMRQSFPEKSEVELRELVWDFYHHLVTQFISAPKMLYQSPETIQAKHLQLSGGEMMQEDIQRGAKAIILLLGHCGNWEIFTASNLYLRPIGLCLEQLYRPLKDKALDDVQLALRTRFGAVTTPKSNIGRSLIQQLNQDGATPRVIAFIADQTPSPAHIGLWTNFLNQPTPWLNGAERLARKYALPVYYLDITRISNRCYRGDAIRISSNASECEEGEVTRRFADLLEKTIQRDPAIWLWTHLRWKHKPQNINKPNESR